MSTPTERSDSSRPGVRALRLGLGTVAELALLVTGPCLLLLADYFSFGAGLQRFFTLAVLFAFVALAGHQRARVRGLLGTVPGCVLMGVVVVWALHVAEQAFHSDLTRPQPCFTDMGRPSVCAGELLRNGINPWAQCVPRRWKPEHQSESLAFCRELGGCADWKGGGSYGRKWTHHGPGYDFMDGYKYGPLMALLYFPATHRAQEAGIAWVNLVFWLAQLGLVFALARAAYPRVRASGLRALVVLLLPAALPAYALLSRKEIHALGRTYVLEQPMPAVFVRAITVMCSNDVLPLCFALLACLFALRGRSALAGVQLGLSLAAKQLPGALLALLLVRVQGVNAKRFVLAAAATAVVFYLPFFVWAPKEMIANLVLFGLVRPTNSSSIRRFLPHDLEPLVSLAQLGLTAVLTVRFMRGERRDGPALLQSATLVLIAFVALNKIVHGNYLLWIQPLLALALAGTTNADPGAARGGSAASPPGDPPG